MTKNQHRRILRLEGDEGKGFKIQGKNTIYPTLIDLAEKCVDYELRRPCPKKGIDGYSTICYGDLL
jgi:hypothetical protein